MVRVLCALACLQLAGCVFSPVPITAGGARQTDEKLLGTWTVTIEDEPEVVTISRDPADPSGDFLVELPYTEGDARKIWRHRAIIAHLAGKHYASLYEIDPERPATPERRFFLTRYEFSGRDKFLLHAPSDWIEQAFEDKLIAGRVIPDRHLSSVQLGANSDELRAFMKARGEKFFFSQEPLVFERVK